MLFMILPSFNGIEFGKRPFIYYKYAKEKFQELPSIAKIHGNLQPRSCFEFSKILTIMGRYQTETGTTENRHHFSIIIGT